MYTLGNRFPAGSNGTWRVLMFGILFSFCLILSSTGSCPAGGKSTKLGGPCRYDTYDGRAEIISVTPIESTGAAKASVRFLFHPDRPVDQKWLQTAGRIQNLRMVNGQDPSLGFIKKYGLETGRAVKCQLKVIIKGTCTPVIFDFPDVDRTDYQP